MSVVAPPAAIWRPLDVWTQGQLWPWFLGQVNAALAESRATPTSWWRSVDRQRDVGGGIPSQHLVGLAVDVVPDSSAVRDAFRRRGFVVVSEGDHAHVQTYPAGVLDAAGVYRFFGFTPSVLV